MGYFSDLTTLDSELEREFRARAAAARPQGAEGGGAAPWYVTNFGRHFPWRTGARPENVAADQAELNERLKLLGLAENESSGGETGKPTTVKRSENPYFEARRLRRRRRARAKRLALTRAAKKSEECGEYVKPSRITYCGLGRGTENPTVNVVVDEDGKRAAHFARLQQCGAVWECPHCAGVIRAGRAAELEEGVRAWAAQGGSFVFVTQTMRHKNGDDLHEMLAVLAAAQREGIGHSRWWKRLREEVGLLGYVRTLEITYGKNGFHPHYHTLLFTSRAITQEEAALIADEYRDRWARAVEAQGGRVPNEHGVDVKALTSVDDAVAVAKYNEKDADGKGAAALDQKQVHGLATEVTRSDWKSARDAGSLTPFEFLDFEEPKAVRLWDEYVTATKGKSSTRWSCGLRAALGLTAVKTDEEIVADAEATGTPEFAIERTLYRDKVLANPQVECRVLEIAEMADADTAPAIVAALLGAEVLPDGAVAPDPGGGIGKRIPLLRFPGGSRRRGR